MLLNVCKDGVFGDYYSLPGGGQRFCETLHEAVVRECLEETGYTVKPVRFAALCETIFTDNGLTIGNPNCAHRSYHIFICEIVNVEQTEPTEKDEMQESSEWVDVNEITGNAKIRLFPKMVADNICDILKGTAPIFLGSNYQN
ncbi:MAG: NUDIX domain-containing protein [Defluviitaleaceae bacterium]|nr:NUDIX domain-containing protein [Defluviitaleaceae bacterium]